MQSYSEYVKEKKKTQSYSEYVKQNGYSDTTENQTEQYSAPETSNISAQKTKNSSLPALFQVADKMRTSAIKATDTALKQPVISDVHSYAQYKQNQKNILETAKNDKVFSEPSNDGFSVDGMAERVYQQETRKKQIQQEYNYLDEETMADLRIMADGLNAEPMTKGLTGLQVAAFGGEEYGKYLERIQKAEEAKERLVDKGYSRLQVNTWAEMQQEGINQQYAADLQQGFAEAAEEHPLLSSFASVGIKLATTPLDAATKLDEAASGKINTNGIVDIASQTDDMIRSSVSDEIAEDSEIGAWLYNVGMSGVDSAVASVMPGGMLFLATDAATSTMRDLTNRGLSAEKAFFGGVAAGVFEGLFEKISIGNFKSLQAVSPLDMKDVVKNVLKSTGVNASEEAATELANILYDTVAHGDKSQFNQLVEEYNGDKAKAFAELALQVGEAGLSGAVMGGGFGVTGSAIGYASNYGDIKAAGQQIKSEGIADAVLEQGKTAPEKSRPNQAYQNAQKKLDKGKSLSDRDIGLVAYENRQYAIDNAPELKGAFESAETLEDVEAIYNTERYRLNYQMPISKEQTDSLKKLDADYKTAKTSLEKFNKSGARAMFDDSLRGKTYTETDLVKTKMPTIGKTDEGNVVSVSSIENVEDGKITVKTSEGTTQALDIEKDIKSVDAQTLWTNAAQSFPDAASAQAYIDNYDGGSIADYTKAFKDYYNLAATGLTLERINGQDVAPYYDLSEQAQIAAVETGRKSMQFQQGVVDLTVKPKTKAQQLQMNMLDSIGKHTGLNFVVVENMQDEGFYKTGSNQVVLSLGSSKGLMLRTAGHETYHYVKENMSDKASEIESFVLDTLKKNKGEKWVNDRLKYYEKLGYKGKQAQIDELVADSLFDVFTNERAVKEFATENQSLAKTISRHIKKLIADIKNIINKLKASGDYAEIKAWQDDLESLEKLNNMFLDALDELATKKADNTNETKKADDKVLLSVKRFKLTESDIQKNILLVGKMDNVVVLSGNEFAKGTVGLPDQVDAFFAKYNYSIENPDIGDVEMNRRGAKDSIAHGIGRTKAASFAAVPYTIEKGKIIDYQNNWKGRQYDTIVLAAPISINNERYYQGIIVIRDNTNQRFYLHEVLTEKEDDASFKTGVGVKHTPGDASPSLISLLKKVKDVNNIDNNNVVFSVNRDTEYLTAVENGDMETAQRLVDEAAEEAMPDSIIRGDDGKLLNVYHGSPSKFTVFNPNKLNVNGNSHGRGFYFTEEKSMAEGYSKDGGQLLSGYLNITNPMSEDKVTIKKSDLLKLIKATCEAEAKQLVDDGDYDSVSEALNDTWVSNYVYTYGTDMNRVYREVADIVYDNDSDVQIIAEMTNVAGAENVLGKVHQFTGYDGVVYTNDRGTHEFVALTSNQFKSADPITYDENGNVIPLSERFDENQEDIRWSRKRPWNTGMQAAEVIRIEKIAQNELYKTDNYLDNITKWLYNDRNGTPYFALYSTEDENNPTILYASKDKRAGVEYAFVLDYIKELRVVSDDDRRPKTFNKILNRLKNANNLRSVHSGVPSNGRIGNGNASVYSRPSGSGVSGALLNCLQNSFERGNSGEGIEKYSTKRDSSISEEASNYILDTKEYREVLGVLERRFNTLGKVKLSPKAIDRYAGRLLQKSKSNYSREQLTERLTALFDFIANSRDVTWEEVTEIAANIAKDMLSESQMLDRSMQNEYSDVLKLMRESRVYISPEVRAEINHNFGSLEAFRRRLGGKLKITVTDESAIPLDVFWRELAEDRSEMFEADINYLDMPSRLVEFFEMTSPQYINPYNIEMDMDEAAYDFALQMYDEYFEIPEVKTEAQKYAAKLEMLKGRYNAKIREIHNSYRERIKEIRTELKAEDKKQIEVTKELYRSRNENYRNKQKETRDKQRLRAQIYRYAQNLTDKLVRPTDKKHIPQELISAVNDFCKTITESGVFTLEKADKLCEAFKSIGERAAEDDGNLSTMYDEEIGEMLSELKKTIKGRRLGELNVNELARVSVAAKYFTHIVSMSNRTFSDNIKEKLLDLQSNAILELDKISPDRKRIKTEMQKGLLKPVTFFELLESPTLMKLYENIRLGEGKWYNTVASAKMRRQEAAEKYNFKSWQNDKITFKPERLDGEIVLSVGEALSLYATANREQGVEHIRLGGIVREEDAKKKLKSKDKAKSVDVRSENIPLTVNDMVEITSQLTKEQKAYADNLIEFMSKDMAALGNEVSTRLFGIKKFNETKYFPLKSASNFLYSKPAVENDARIKHMSMTKQTIPKANNPVVIGDFTETVMNHCNDMALYYSFCLPLEDFNRVYNFKTQPTMFERATSIKQKIDRAYGSKANGYIKQLLTDINGGVTHQAGADFVNKMISLAKKNAVFGSLSVAVQQPSAVARAFLYIDPKYFVSSTFTKRDWNELKKYAPVAGVKEMGYFDTNIGKQAVDWMTEDGYDSLKEKAFALFKDKNYRDDVLSFLPSYMDRITWGHIWNAVKRETAHNNPDMDFKSEEFLGLAGERFTYVIDRTQVYDSVFSRSEWMRSKDTGVKVATAFMSEPLTNYNMLYSAAVKARHGDKKFAAKAFSAYIVSVAFNSMLKSLVTAGRDDDDDKSYWEKYIAHFVGSFIDEPFGMIPYLKDFISLLQGYDSKRMDTQAFADIADAAMIMFDDKKSGWDKFKSALGAVGVASGLPFKNLIRDGEMIYNAADKMFKGEYEPTTPKGIGYTIQSELGFETPTQYDQLIEAYLEDDEAHYEKVNNNLKASKSEKAISSGIKESAKTKLQNGELTEDEAVRVLCDVLEMDKNDAFWNVDKWKETTNGETYSKYDDFADAVRTGKNLNDVINEYLDHGVTKKTLASRITTAFKKEYIELYRTDRAEASALRRRLLDAYGALGYDRDDKSDDIADWLED